MEPTLSDFYYAVATLPGQVYSTDRRGFVATSDSTYLTWISTFGANFVGNVQTEVELFTLLESLYPAGLPAQYGFSAVVDYDKLVNVLINSDFQINQRGNIDGAPPDFVTDMWQVAGGVGVFSNAPVYDPQTGVVETSSSLTNLVQMVEKSVWSRGFAGETMTISCEDLENLSGPTEGLEFLIGGVASDYSDVASVTIPAGAGVRAAAFEVPATSTGDFLRVRLSAGGTRRFRNLALVRGSTPFAGTRRNRIEELGLARNYYVPPVPVAVPPLHYFLSRPSGAGVSAGLNALAITTGGAAAGRFEFQQFIPANDVTFDQMGCEVSTLLAGGRFVLGIYSDNNGSPGAIETQSVSELTTDTTGFKSSALSPAGIGGPTAPVTLLKNTRYWFAIWSSGTQVYRALNVGALPAISCGFSAGTTHETVLRATQAYSPDMPIFAPAVSAISAASPFIKARVA